MSLSWGGQLENKKPEKGKIIDAEVEVGKIPPPVSGSLGNLGPAKEVQSSPSFSFTGGPVGTSPSLSCLYHLVYFFWSDFFDEFGDQLRVQENLGPRLF